MSTMTQSSLEDATRQVLAHMAAMYEDRGTLSGTDVVSLLADLACYARCERSALPLELHDLQVRAQERPGMVIDKQVMISKLLRAAS